MAEIISIPFGFFTRDLPARDYSIDPALTGGPVAVASAPAFAGAEIRGYVLGPAGSYAMFAYNVAAFQSAPPPSGYQSSAMVVPAGQRFKFRLNKEQVVYALASISPSVSWGNAGTTVFISYHVALEELILETNPGGGVGPSGGGDGGVTGPPVGWRK